MWELHKSYLTLREKFKRITEKLMNINLPLKAFGAEPIYMKPSYVQ